ncbi:uncharacterized protein DDB_G0286299-like [Diabrotica virgifera virgifera]|uniref:Uncharacterized protein n=1 Tax=Diabrotica virgifera virgifera TaxID=50390 RepID=A0ABM5L5M3_DIAVI|nr:uncharacterized protein DDB_G0286299-like [Diabrotica virgifera virgifera]
MDDNIRAREIRKAEQAKEKEPQTGKNTQMDEDADEEKEGFTEVNRKKGNKRKNKEKTEKENPDKQVKSNSENQTKTNKDQNNEKTPDKGKAATASTSKTVETTQNKNNRKPPPIILKTIESGQDILNTSAKQGIITENKFAKSGRSIKIQSRNREDYHGMLKILENKGNQIE